METEHPSDGGRNPLSVAQARSHVIRRAADCPGVLIQHMRVDLRRLRVFMPQQLLHATDVNGVFIGTRRADNTDDLAAQRNVTRYPEIIYADRSRGPARTLLGIRRNFISQATLGGGYWGVIAHFPALIIDSSATARGHPNRCTPATCVLRSPSLSGNVIAPGATAACKPVHACGPSS